MSRLSKKPIVIPEKTDVTITGSFVVVKGPLGELSRQFPLVVAIKKEGSEITVVVTNPHRDYKPLDGESRLGRVTCFTCHQGDSRPKTQQ